MSQESIGLIGGTGPQGRGLAMRLAQAGFRVWVGSRSPERAKETAASLNTQAGTTNIDGAGNAEVVAGSKYVLLTVPFDSAVQTLEGLGGHFTAGKVFVDVTVPLRFEKGGPTIVELPEGSASAHLRRIVPEGIPFVGAFKTLPAHLLEHVYTPLECDTFVFGDDESAKAEVMEIARRIPTLRPVDVGDLGAAPFVEGMTALVIRINRTLKSREGRYRIVGAGP